MRDMAAGAVFQFEIGDEAPRQRGRVLGPGEPGVGELHDAQLQRLRVLVDDGVVERPLLAGAGHAGGDDIADVGAYQAEPGGVVAPVEQGGLAVQEAQRLDERRVARRRLAAHPLPGARIARSQWRMKASWATSVLDGR